MSTQPRRRTVPEETLALARFALWLFVLSTGAAVLQGVLHLLFGDGDVWDGLAVLGGSVGVMLAAGCALDLGRALRGDQ